MEKDLSWVLQEGVVRIDDQIIDSEEFSLGVRHLKARCMVAGIESGKQPVWKQLATRKFDPAEQGAAAQSVHAMHATIKAFLEKKISS